MIEAMMGGGGVIPYRLAFADSNGGRNVFDIEGGDYILQSTGTISRAVVLSRDAAEISACNSASGGNLVIYGGADYTDQLELLNPFGANATSGQVMSASYSPNGQYLAVIGASQIAVYDRSDYSFALSPTAAVGPPSNLSDRYSISNFLAWTHDSKYLLAQTASGVATSWDAEDGFSVQQNMSVSITRGFSFIGNTYEACGFSATAPNSRIVNAETGALGPNLGTSAATTGYSSYGLRTAVSLSTSLIGLYNTDTQISAGASAITGTNGGQYRDASCSDDGLLLATCSISTTVSPTIVLAKATRLLDCEMSYINLAGSLYAVNVSIAGGVL